MTKENGYLLLTGILSTAMCVIHFMDLVLRPIGLRFFGGVWKLNGFRLLFCVCVSFFVKHYT